MYKIFATFYESLIMLKAKMQPINYDFEERNYHNRKYRFYCPKVKEKLPLVVALHGAGSRGDDNRLQCRKCVTITNIWTKYQKPFPCYVLAPQCPAKRKWVDVDWEKGSYSLENVPDNNEIDRIINIIDELIKQCNIDENRIYVVGNSMGGYAVWYLLAKYSEKFAGALPICGGGDPKLAIQMKDVPIWACHGAADTVVPVSGSRDMARALKDINHKEFIYTEYENKGHDVENYFLEEREGDGYPIRIQWLFEKKRVFL